MSLNSLCPKGQFLWFQPGTRIHRSRDIQLYYISLKINVVIGAGHKIYCSFPKDKTQARASLVVQWLRIHLPMQGTRVQALVRQGPTCHKATKPVSRNCWACTLEPVSHDYWARVPRARAPQQEKPLQWEATAMRSDARQQRVAPAHRN